MSDRSHGSVPQPASPNRRRLLVTMGFGAANVAIARSLGGSGTIETVDTTGSLPAPMVSVPAAQVALPKAQQAPTPDHTFDVVITNGRLIDPELGFDAVGDVGIDGTTITALGGTGYVGRTIFDATGRVVAPGFIDLLSSEPNGVGEWNKLADGVTTNLAMHGVNNYASAFFDRWTGATPIHFGGAWHQHFVRAWDPEIAADIGDALDEAQLTAFERITDKNLRNGFAGICFSPEYSPGTTFEEMERLSRVAVRLGHMVYFHLRYSEPGTGPEGVREAIAIAGATGTAVHLEHLASTGGTEPEAMEESLGLIEEARANGLDITACVYPYEFWATTLGSTRFAPGWGDRYGITFDDLEVAGDGRRLSAATFEQAQAKNLLVAARGTIPTESIDMALAKPWVMVGSDAILTESRNNHPRASGTFARLLGLYARDRGVLSLADALAKVTILPARRFESMLPDLTRKGRLQRGADADIVVFDPATIIDRATVAQPDLVSSGIDLVLVEGTPALSGGQIDRSVVAGRALRSTVAGQ